MGETLARYRDPAGDEHLLVLTRARSGLLLVDRSPGDRRVVAELGADEGRDQALAVLRDAEANTEGLMPKPAVEGYLARAARTAGPLCRVLTADDLSAPVADRGREAA